MSRNPLRRVLTNTCKVMQKKIKKEEEVQKPVNLDKQKSEFEDLKNTKVQKATRIVHLFHHCNGNGFDLEVPADSKLKDGDYTSDQQFPGEKLNGTYLGQSSDKYRSDQNRKGWDSSDIRRDLDRLKG
jgi:hypothetical protein